jgi:hypothetical protein
MAGELRIDAERANPQANGGDEGSDDQNGHAGGDDGQL